MDSFADYTIPVWHPLVVHFPIAALGLAAVAGLVWLVTKDSRWFLATSFLLLAGAIGAAVAYLSGDAMHEQSDGVPVVDAFVGLHERFGLLTLLASIFAATAWVAAAAHDRRLIGNGNDPGGTVRVPLGIRVGLVLLALAAAVLALRTGHLGGLMVWGAPPP